MKILSNRNLCGLALLGIVAFSSFWAGQAIGEGEKEEKPMLWELRTYTSPEGKLESLHARFRNHTLKLFEKHGMKNVVYLVPTDPKLAENTLIYLIAHESKEAADKSWKDFREDPEWNKVRTESEKNGKLVEKVESQYLNPTDYSPMK